MKSKFHFEPVTDWGLWERLVNESEQGTIFCSSRYLDHIGLPYRCWFIYLGAEICGGLCIQESEGGRHALLDDLVIHNGLWFTPSNSLKLNRYRSRCFKITESAIEHLTKIYNRIELSLAPQFEDIRPFLWFRYHDPTNNKISLSLRYTSYLDLQDLTQSKSPETSNLFKNLSTLRQRNLREAWTSGSTVERNGEVDVLLTNYRTTLGYSESEFLITRQRMSNLIEALIEQGMGELYEVRGKNGNILYSSFFAWDAKRAYYLFGAGVKPRVRYQGTLLFWEALVDLARKGIGQIDWEGVNSPDRGGFKLSFGGILLPYAELRWVGEIA